LFFFLWIFSLFCKKEVLQTLWKNRTRDPSSSFFSDFLVGVCAWIVAYPAVGFVGKISDAFVFYAFHIDSYEQVAERVLKMSLQSPILLSAILFHILILAPVMEEFLFRGMLQNFMKRFLSRKWAIISTSALFAFAHYSISQGAGNIPLILSLFSCSCFLGFIYERQGSLLASISLHFTTNLLSTLYLLYFQN
jgi:membrane protease YdiL (CAAX protease family)